MGLVLKMFRNTVLVCLLGAGVGLLNGAASAQIITTYDIRSSVTNFATSFNDPWSVGYRTVRASTDFTAMSQYGNFAYGNGVATRLTATGLGAAGVYRNFNSFQLNAGDPFATILESNGIMMHPDTFGMPVIRFTAPKGGLYDISYRTTRFTQGPGTARVSVVRNGTILSSQTVSANNYVFQPVTTHSFFAGAGEVFDFVSDIGDNSSFYDSTGIRATVVMTTPEPAGMLALAIPSLAILRKRRKRS